jgi:putative ABC transport system permease protein
LFGIMSMDQLLRQSRWPQCVFATMVVIFGSIALVLSAVGLYAVTAYSVTQRTHEIGIRMALGVQAAQVWSLVLRRVMVQRAMGIALGLAGAMAVGQLLRGVISQTGPLDVITLASVALLLVLVSIAACFVPARRATHLDPVVVLRCE